MDEHREEREELAVIQRDDADDARTQDSDRIYWATEQGYSWAQFVSAEGELWSR